VLALGVKLDLNAATEDELAQIHGVGRVLARALVRARDDNHGFRTWEDVDGVVGVGPEKLRLLQESTQIRR
jgi:competence protein ComEA